MLNGSEIISFIKCKILIGIQLGPEHLLILSSDISRSISILSQVLKTNELGNELKRHSVYGLLPLYFFFDSRSSAIVEKYVLKALAISFGSVTFFLLDTMQFMDSLFLGFMLTNSVIPSHSFLKLLLFSLK